MTQPKPIGAFLGLSPEKRAEIEEHRRRIASGDQDYIRECDRASAARDLELATQAEEERRDAARILSKERWKLERSQIPERFHPFLHQHDWTAGVEKAMAFVEAKDRHLLVLAGGEGCGKTVAASIALMRCPGRGLFVTAHQVVRAGLYSEEFWESLKVPGILVIDELGTEPLDAKGWGTSNLAAVLSDRHAALRKTICTSNLGHTEFFARYGDDGGRLVGRFREAGVYEELTGASLRKGSHP